MNSNEEVNNEAKQEDARLDAAPELSDIVNATDVLSEHLNKPRRRFKLAPQASPKTTAIRFPAWLTVCGAFVVGTLLGVFVMKQRHAADKVVVTVNTETIRASDFYARLEAAAGPQVLKQMVSEMLTRQYAQQRHAMPTQAEVQAVMEQINAQAALASPTHALPDPDEVRQRAQAQTLHEKLIASGVDVSEGEVQGYYRAQTDPRNPAARFVRPESIRIAAIVTPSETQARQAEAALKQGTAFARVAQMYSQDRSRANGGALPPILRGRTPARHARGLEDAIFGLEPGKTTRPQKLMGAWWIMTCLEKTPGETLPFAQVQAQCRREARLLKAQRANGTQVEADFERYRRSVPVQVFWERYAAAIPAQEYKLTPGKF